MKFNFSYIYRSYKHAIMRKSLKKAKELNGSLDDTNIKEDLKDILEDNYFQKFLTQQAISDIQLQPSLINNCKKDLVVDMPGIEYDKILYHKMKSQRSDPSLDANKHT